MRIQLILENQEVELNDKVSIPLNKSFENLNNPTDIISDYSKTINIPMTSKNNLILSNSYRLDRTIIEHNFDTNLGIYLDPTKRIPMKLLYNSSVILEGYAKFVSSNYSTKNKYYTLNLFGVLGDIFQKLKNIVLTDEQLTDEQRAEDDGGKKYVLDDPCLQNPRILNSDYVEASWRNVKPQYANVDNPLDIIGFAPSYRGYYSDFSSDKIQINNEVVNISDSLTASWANTYKNLNPSKTDEEAQTYAESLGAGDIVGDGLKDYQMREYRAYMLKPYIYFDKLMRMFQSQITKLSDYSLELDENWFNVNNPYWTRMCYMLDYLDSRDGNKDSEEQLTNAESFKFYPTTGGMYCRNNTAIINDYIAGNSSFSIMSSGIDIRVEAPVPKSAVKTLIVFDKPVTLTFLTSTYFIIEATIYDIASTTSSIKKYYASVYDYNDVKSYVFCDESDYIKLTQGPTTKTIYGLQSYIDTGTTDNTDVTYGVTLSVQLPNVTGDFAANATNGITLSYRVDCVNHFKDSLFTISEKQKPDNDNFSVDITPSKAMQYSKLTINPSYLQRTWRDFIPVSIQSIYHKEEPLFNVILQYTKLFGLVWNVDYNEKKVIIQRKSTYFKNITIEDWSGRVDRSKDFIVEPITFGKKYTTFNYDDVDGYRYSAYKDKYGLNYGDKRIYTGYDFGFETNKLFNGVNPSSASSKSYVDINSLINWDLISLIPITQEVNPVIDCEDEDESAAISLYNWYLRGDNADLSEPVYITDDTGLMKSSKEYCWIDKSIIEDNGIKIESFPVFNIAFESPRLYPNLIGKSLSCVFNTPNVDYTYNKSVTKSNGNAIYDLFWNDYISERYNIQNKKVTCYVNLYPEEFNTFKFSKFIEVDNQLFMINKLYDYNLNSNSSTKVELIQVTDPDVYKNDTIVFNPFTISPSEINIIGSVQPTDNGRMAIEARGDELTNIDNTGSWGLLTGRFTVFNGVQISKEDADTDPTYNYSDYVYTEGGDPEDNLGVDSIDLFWCDMTNKRWEGSISYTTQSGSIYTVPIVIDYTI